MNKDILLKTYRRYECGVIESFRFRTKNDQIYYSGNFHQKQVANETIYEIDDLQIIDEKYVKFLYKSTQWSLHGDSYEETQYMVYMPLSNIVIIQELLTPTKTERLKK